MSGYSRAEMMGASIDWKQGVVGDEDVGIVVTVAEGFWLVRMCNGSAVTIGRST